MRFKPIQQQKIYEQIIEQIKAMIQKGKLKPGDRLPSERELADTLSVSRASVREALSALNTMGLIEVKSGEGTFIKQSDIDSVLQLLTMLLPVGADMVSEIAQVRKGLEIESAGLAALNADENDIEAIGAIIDKMEEDLKAGVVGEVTDWNFHFALAQATKNSLFVKIMNTISEPMQKTVLIHRKILYQREGNPQLLFEQHRDIFLAIKNRDPELARRKMYEHLKYAERELELLKPVPPMIKGQ